MDKLLITALLSLLPLTNFTHPHEEDPYTTYIQEKLIELGYLDVANGINDKKTQSAIKLFQSNSDIFVDGMVGDETSNSSSADMFILKLNFSGNIE